MSHADKIEGANPVERCEECERTDPHTHPPTSRGHIRNFRENFSFLEKAGLEIQATRTYRDAEGNVCSLSKLVRTEPQWAANTILNSQDTIEKQVRELDYWMIAKKVADERSDGLLKIRDKQAEQLKALRLQYDEAVNVIDANQHYRRKQAGQLKAKDNAFQKIVALRKENYGPQTTIVKMTKIAEQALKGTY